jgi:DNA invertase Pin-like site-specific DNA recombinase
VSRAVAQVQPAPSLSAVPYLRTSTDDKGQDPLRQLDVIQPWATREGVRLSTHVTDEGTSAWKVQPFDRPRFVEAVRRAHAEGAGGIVVETLDRFARPNHADDFVYAKEKLRREEGLSLWFADVALRDAGTFSSGIVLYVRAHQAGEFSKLLSAKTLSGLRRAEARGVVMGRPRKTLTPAELAYIEGARAKGTGYPSIAHVINRRRGVFNIKTPEVAARKSVSEALVRKAYAALGRTKSAAAQSLGRN